MATHRVTNTPPPWRDVNLFDADQCLGGNGYVEDSGLPRLFRESPLNSI